MTDQHEDDKSKKKQPTFTASGMGTGMAVGIAIGAGVGVAFGAAFSQAQNKDNE